MMEFVNGSRMTSHIIMIDNKKFMFETTNQSYMVITIGKWWVPLENGDCHWKTIGKPLENGDDHWKTIGKPLENHRKTIGKQCFIGIPIVTVQDGATTADLLSQASLRRWIGSSWVKISTQNLTSKDFGDVHSFSLYITICMIYIYIHIILYIYIYIISYYIII